MENNSEQFVSTFKERLKEALVSRRMTQSALAKAIDVSTVSVTKYIAGTSEPRTLQLKRICDVLAVNEAWILGMDYPMERISDGTTKCVDDVSGTAPEPLSQTEQGLIDIFRSLSFSDQLQVLNLASDLQKAGAGI